MQICEQLHGGRYRAVGRGLEGDVTARASWLDVVRFYGFGNERRAPRADAYYKGLLFVVGGSAYPDAWDVARPFEEAHAEVATYLTAPIPTSPTLALRALGKKLWDAYPFHEAAFVGGATAVRGFPEHRFAGDAALIGNAELRLSLFRFSFLAPDEFGVFGLGDVGRVYLSGEISDRWHAAAGGGIWVSFLHRSNPVSLAYARSPESTGLYLRAGFLY